MLRTNDIGVVVADLSMPGRDGIDLISHIKTSSPEVSILVLTMHEDSEYAARALRSGASGYMTKASTSDDLTSAIRRIASGRSYVSPSVSENLMERFTRSDSETPPHTTLSHREFRIFELLVQCQTTTRIARELSLSVKTVSTHKARLLKKMGLQHQGELVRYAIEHKLTGH
jgi:DNA-binding NarL/FixJ family response regulator